MKNQGDKGDLSTLRSEQSPEFGHTPGLTVDQALALVEQERLDVLAEGHTEEFCASLAPYVLASAVRKDRKHILFLTEEKGKAQDERDKLREDRRRMLEALRRIAKPALGGKQQQYEAQAVLIELGEQP